jgi:hypothetical protein
LTEDLARDQPVEEGADGGEVLLDRGVGQALLEPLDIAGDVDRLDVLERQAVVLAPAKELGDGLGIGGPGVLVADVGGEEFEEPPGVVVAEVGDEGRDGEAIAAGPEGDPALGAVMDGSG